MAVRKIVLYGDEVLRKKTKFIKTFDKRLSKLIEDMFDTMYAANGVGLAAPQIGILRKLFVVDTQLEGEKYALANVKIVWSGEELEEMNEGCLSIPGVEGDVSRPSAIRIQGNDAWTGDLVEFQAEGLLARVIQHELDHLNGVLFIDRLPADKRKPLERRLQELAAA